MKTARVKTQIRKPTQVKTLNFATREETNSYIMENGECVIHILTVTYTYPDGHVNTEVDIFPYTHNYGVTVDTDKEKAPNCKFSRNFANSANGSYQRVTLKGRD
jgi:hypothetical protein